MVLFGLLLAAPVSGWIGKEVVEANLRRIKKENAEKQQQEEKDGDSKGGETEKDDDSDMIGQPLVTRTSTVSSSSSASSSSSSSSPTKGSGVKSGSARTQRTKLSQCDDMNDKVVRQQDSTMAAIKSTQEKEQDDWRARWQREVKAEKDALKMAAIQSMSARF